MGLVSAQENSLTPISPPPKGGVHMRVTSWVQSLAGVTHVPGTAWAKNSWGPFPWESLRCCVSASALSLFSLVMRCALHGE